MFSVVFCHAAPPVGFGESVATCPCHRVCNNDVPQLQVKLGLSIDEEEGGADDEDLPPLEEDIVDEGSRMEEVD